MSELTHCSICGCALEDEAECYEVENEILCQDCYDNETVVCDHCGEHLFLFPLFLYHHNHRWCAVSGIEITLFHSLFDSRHGYGEGLILSDFRNACA